MCHIPSAPTLHALLRASPRFYQVFKSRRDYHLTQLAINQCEEPACAWDVIKVSRLPQPPSPSDVESFIKTYQSDDGYRAPIMVPEVSIPMIRFGRLLDWFITDFSNDTLSNLKRLRELADLNQAQTSFDATLSTIERGRIVSAFSYFEIFRYLFPPVYTDWSAVEKLQPGIDYLRTLDLCDVEAIACVRDYFIRRLWAIYDEVEDNYVQEKCDGFAQNLHRNRKDAVEWFGDVEKGLHLSYMENMMHQGLPFLKDVLTAEGKPRTNLVLSIGSGANGFLTDTLEFVTNNEPLDFSPNPVVHLSSFEEASDELPIGWHWVRYHNNRVDPASPNLKGLRDWGFVFWDKRRMEAAGVLYPDSDLLYDKLREYVFDDRDRDEEPSAVARLENPQIERPYNYFKHRKPPGAWSP